MDTERHAEGGQLEVARDGGFSDRLREVMNGENALSFSRKIGISDTAVRKLLEGSGNPTMQVLKSISAASGVNIHWLVTGSGSREIEAEKTTIVRFEDELYKMVRRVIDEVAEKKINDVGKLPQEAKDELVCVAYRVLYPKYIEKQIAYKDMEELATNLHRLTAGRF